MHLDILSSYTLQTDTYFHLLCLSSDGTCIVGLCGFADSTSSDTQGDRFRQQKDSSLHAMSSLRAQEKIDMLPRYCPGNCDDSVP